MSIKWCPICGDQLGIIEYPVNGVMMQFWKCPDCGFEDPVVVPAAASEEPQVDNGIPESRESDQPDPAA